MGEISFYTIILVLCASALRMSTPYLFSAMGELCAEKSGVMNLGVEGMMIIGAFFSFVAVFKTGNPWVGILVAILVGGTAAFIFGILTISLRSNQIVTGIAMNLLCMGIATYLYRVVFGISKANTPFVKEAFKPIKIPLLSSIPFVGEVLFSHYLLVYIALLIVPVIGFLIYKTTFGLSVIACGENPKAADTRGIDVNRVRYITTVIGGCLAGISGSFLAIATINEFTPGAISGRGWISIVLVIFGKWTPKGILWGALFFGFVEACTLQFQVLPMLNRVPYQFIMMLPYLLTIIILFYIRKMKYGQAPTYLGVPYKRN